MNAAPPARPSAAGLLVAVMLAAAAAACGGPILANPPADHPTPPPTPAPVARPTDPQPISFPRDEGPHDRLTEWWYYTGHLLDETGRRYGFEFVVFRAERGAFPVSWASHLALTDEAAERFTYAHRSEVGPQVDASPRASDEPAGFNLTVAGADRTRPETLAERPWQMRGSGGRDRLTASLSPAEAEEAELPGGFELELDLSTDRPPVLHDGEGFIDFGPAGGSYYYSRTRMTATGSLVVGGRRLAVEGVAWFDHQWGDFIAVGGGGWDWFAVNLEDGTDLTISLVRDGEGRYPLVYGTLVSPDGRFRHLSREAFEVTATGRWTSSKTGAAYPAGWTIRLLEEDLTLDLTPTVADQELDTRATSGVIYWEGSQHVGATRGGKALKGEAYVELTGYARAGS